MWAWRAGTLLGVPLKIHVTFPLVLLWALFQYGGLSNGRQALFGLLVVLLLFGSVLLHELGHAIVARRLGAAVEDITLLPFGGVARFRPLNDRARDEFLISLAGPLMNVALAVWLTGLLPFLKEYHEWQLLATPEGTSRLSLLVSLMFTGFGERSLWGLLSYLIVANLLLALFNLLPVFPLDGGRVLRSLLAAVLPYQRATIVAVRLGQIGALLLILLGLRVDWTLALIGLFMLWGSGPELRRAEMRRILERGRVADFMSRPPRLAHDFTVAMVNQVIQLAGDPAYPVTAGGEVVGILEAASLHQQPAQMPIQALMHGFQPVVTLSQTLYEAQLVLYHSERPVAAVMDEGRYVGLLTQSDIERGYYAIQQRTRLTEIWQRSRESEP